jgi:hypothetical protein
MQRMVQSDIMRSISGQGKGNITLLINGVQAMFARWPLNNRILGLTSNIFNGKC